MDRKERNKQRHNRNKGTEEGIGMKGKPIEVFIFAENRMQEQKEKGWRGIKLNKIEAFVYGIKWF